VQEVIDRLGYRRNDVARALKSGRSNTIGVVIAGSDPWELPRTLKGVEQAADRAGYFVNLASFHGGSGETLVAAVERLVNQAVEGIAVIADRPLMVDALERIVSRVPITVVMSGEITNPSIGSIELDQELGATMATEHLLALGHRNIVHLTGRLDAFDARLRLAAWQRAMAAAGIHDPVYLEGDFSPESGYRLAKEAMAMADRPTALFAGNDHMAMGTLSALAHLGVDVPGEVSVVGFDDIWGSDYLQPPLTTIRQDFVALGRTSVELLLGMMASDPVRHHLLPPTLVVRDSTGPAPA
jgi:DNA-binding LacI/PurR family transcriptional regulator